MTEVVDDDPFRKIVQEREWRVKAHSRLLESADVKQELKRLDDSVSEFVYALQAIFLSATRAPRLTEDYLLFRRLDDAIESAVAIRTLASNGMLYVARRELRYLLEAMTKYLATDQKWPNLEFAKRLGYFEREIAMRSIGPIDVIALGMLSPGGAQRFKESVRAEFDRLSTFVHASVEQVRARTVDAENGVFIGFETAAELKEFVEEMHNVFGVTLVLGLHGLGHALTGDVFVQIWDEDEKWPFRHHQFVAEVSKYFDYKQVRQSEQ